MKEGKNLGARRGDGREQARPARAKAKVKRRCPSRVLEKAAR